MEARSSDQETVANDFSKLTISAGFTIAPKSITSDYLAVSTSRA
jgi:hypothetical protein